MADLQIRRAVILGDADKDGDQIFIMDSWLRSYRKSPDCNLPDEVFFPTYRLVIKRLLATSTVEVIHPPDSPNVILGYVVHDPGVCHWVYIKRDFRGQGLAKLLVERAGPNVVLTFTTPLGRKRLKWPVRPRALRFKLNKDFKHV